GQHHVTGTHTPVRRFNPLAHAGEVYSHRSRILEDTDAGSLGYVGKTERIGQWIDLESMGKIDSLKIAARSERITDALHWPGLDCNSHFLLEEPHPGQRAIGVRFLKDIEIALALDDSDVADFRDGLAHVVNARLRQFPQRLGGWQADPLNNL